jgi:hypothetical protein
MDRTSANPIRVVGCMIEFPQLQVPRQGRGGRRLGAGRKPNCLKRIALQPITAAEIVARRHPLSQRLSPEELAMLHALMKKLAEPSPDGPRNQKESNREARSPVTSHQSDRKRIVSVGAASRETPLLRRTSKLMLDASAVWYGGKRDRVDDCWRVIAVVAHPT